MLTFTSDSSLQWIGFLVSCICILLRNCGCHLCLSCVFVCVCVFRGVLPQRYGHVSHFPSDLLFSSLHLLHDFAFFLSVLSSL